MPRLLASSSCSAIKEQTIIMKRINTLVVAVFAVLALSAGAASVASAALPELVSGKGGAVKGEIKGKSEAKTTTVLESMNKTTVTCQSASSAKGKAGGEGKEPLKETEGTVVTFKECKESLFGGNCENTKTAGEIVTTALETKLGYVTGSGKKEVGLEFYPAKTNAELTTPFVKFECTGGFAKIEVRGAVIGQFGAGEFNKKTKSLKLVFEKGAEAGEQKITEIEGGKMKNVHLESSLNKGTFELSNQQGKGVVEFEEEVELKA
jgi:hypothetical protein